MGLTKPRAAQIFNLDYKQSTRTVTVTNITLSGGAPNSVDGINLSLNDRVLVTGQTTGSQNGLYLVTTLGSGSNGTWARTSDGNETGEIEAGMIVMVTEGAIYADTQWKLITDDPITIGSTALVFTQNYLANSISSGTSNVTVNANANVTISSAGTANVLTVSSTGTVTSGTASVTGNVTGGNILTGGLISATGNVTASYFLGNVACASGIFSSRIFNGTSEANIGASGGNANISIGGTSNVAVFATTGQFITGLLSVTGNITSGNIAATNLTGTNVSVTGTVTAASTVGGVITGTSASLSGNVSGGNLNVTGNIVDTGALTIITSSNGNIDLSPNGTGNVNTGANLSVTGRVTAASTVGGVITGTSTSVTGTQTAASTVGGVITGSSVSVTGTATAASTVGGVITGSSTSVTGTQTAASTVGGAITGSSVSVTGAVSGASASVSGGVTAASVAGGVITGTSISVTGTQTAASTVGGVITGSSASVTGAVTGASVVGGVMTGTSLSVSGNITSASNISGGNATITTQINTTSLSASGNIRTAGTVSSTGNITGGNISTAIVSATGAIIGANNLIITAPSPTTEGGQLVLAWANISGITGQANSTWNLDVDSTNNLRIFSQNATGAANVAASFSPLNGNITVAGNVSPAAIYTNNYYYANGVVFGGGGGTPGGANTQIQFNDNGAFNGTAGLTFNKTTNAVATTGTFSATANITGGNILTAGSISATGNLTANGLFSNGQVSSVGNVFAPNVDVSTGTVFCGNIVNNNANAVGNIGSSAKYFNTVFAKATSAQYADLAEMYLADSNYAPGTVVEFGGLAEITATTASHTTQVAGIISTNPSYLMNAAIEGGLALPVALVGRVPCQVVGTIAKGDRLVASHVPGVATVLDNSKYQPACIIGKALEDYDSTEVGVIEVAVGRT